MSRRRSRTARTLGCRDARGLIGFFVGMIVVVGAAGGSMAQGVDCGRLQADIRSSESDSGQRDGSGFTRAADQQRREIERTRRYAAQLGCGERQGGFFDSGPPPECSDIEDRLGRMQDNLDRMQDRASALGSDGRAARQSAMIARYNTFCAGDPAGNGLQGSVAAIVPDDGRSPADLRSEPMNPDDLSTVPLNGDIMQDGSEPSRNAGRAICVRSCDGGYFPLSAQVRTDQLDQLDSLCKASCPNTEAHLYTMRGGDGLTAATAVDGTSYTTLPTAFKFEKSYSPTCTCKPPGQSWAQALEGAEKMLSSGEKRDVTVTAALSDQMAKPQAPVSPSATSAKGKAGKDKAAAALAQAAMDKRTAAEAQRASQAPTASNESAGIGGSIRGERVLGRSDGLRVTSAGPDGTTRQIRLIVP